MSFSRRSQSAAVHPKVLVFRLQRPALDSPPSSTRDERKQDAKGSSSGVTLQKIALFLGLLLSFRFLQLPLVAQASPHPLLLGRDKDGTADDISLSSPLALIKGTEIPALQAFVRAVNAPTNWCGLDTEQGTYLLATPGAAPAGVELSSRFSFYSSLDLTTPVGHHVYKSAGQLGHFEGYQKRFPMDPASSELGWFPLAKLLFPQTLTEPAWHDGGLVTFEGVPLLKVSYFGQAGHEHGPNTGKRYRSDYYFSPDTHLLVKTADMYSYPRSRQEHRRVLVFGDYRADSDVLLPHSMKLLLNGSAVWTATFPKIDNAVCITKDATDLSKFQ